MSEVTGAAPLAPETPAPGAQPVIAPTSPTGSEAAKPEGDKSVTTPRTYTEDEHKSLVDQRVKERLSKERRRIERTVRAEMERDFYRDLATSRPSAAEPDKPKGPPDPNDFKDVQSYVRAMVKYERDQEREAESREREEREPQEQADRSAREYARSLVEKLSGEDDLKDFDDLVFREVEDGGPPFTDPMVAAIHESDRPRQLAYYLATHLDETRRIAKMPATRQVRELGKIEDKLAAPPKPTAAPAPIVPNGGSNASGKKDYAQMSTEEHIKAYRNRHKRNK